MPGLDPTPLAVRGSPTRDGVGDEARTLEELLSELLERNRQLEHALESRVIIEQAKGVLVERSGLDVERAFAIRRRSARNTRMPIHMLAARVVASRETPPEISAAAS